MSVYQYYIYIYNINIINVIFTVYIVFYSMHSDQYAALNSLILIPDHIQTLSQPVEV